MRNAMLCALFALIVVGCQPPPIFYWGDYSSTLYDYRKEPSDETMLTHMNTLQTIIVTAPSKNMKVPPGVHAELGYYLLKQGKEKEGMQHLDTEMKLFPESKVFLVRLKAEYERGKK